MTDTEKKEKFNIKKNISTFAGKFKSKNFAIKKVLLGRKNKRGVIPNIFLYSMAVILCFVFLYPIFYIISYSFMSAADVVDPLVKYLPTSFTWSNYAEAAKVLDFWKALWQTLLVSLLPSLLSVVSTSLVGYGLARFNFFGKLIIFMLIIASFIIPPQITMITQLIMYTKLGLLDNILIYILPATFAQGLRSSIFILIFWQYFRTLPQVLEEAAQIDGAGYFKIFISIAIPTAIPAYVVCFLFSFVWYYNETALATLYFGEIISTLPMQLEKFQSSYQDIFGVVSETGKSVNEAKYLAGVTLTILPLLLTYAVLQKSFVESVDKTGITGE